MKDMATWNDGDWIGASGALSLFAFLVIGGLIAVRRSEEVVGHPRGSMPRCGNASLITECARCWCSI